MESFLNNENGKYIWMALYYCSPGMEFSRGELSKIDDWVSIFVNTNFSGYPNFLLDRHMDART